MLQEVGKHMQGEAGKHMQGEAPGKAKGRDMYSMGEASSMDAL